MRSKLLPLPPPLTTTAMQIIAHDNTRVRSIQNREEHEIAD